MKLILENWRKYEQQVLQEETDEKSRRIKEEKSQVEKEVREYLIEWINNYRPDSHLGKRFESWFNTHKKGGAAKYNYKQIHTAMVESMKSVKILPLDGDEGIPGIYTPRRSPASLGAYGRPPLPEPYDNLKNGMFIVNYVWWITTPDHVEKNNFIIHEANHWLDWFKAGLSGDLSDTEKFASETVDRELLEIIFLDEPVQGHGLPDDLKAYFSKKVEQRAYLKTYIHSLTKDMLKKICWAQQIIKQFGGYKYLPYLGVMKNDMGEWSAGDIVQTISIDEEGNRISNYAEDETVPLYDYIRDTTLQGKLRVELTLFFNCNENAEDAIIDAVEKLAKARLRRDTGTRYAE